MSTFIHRFLFSPCFLLQNVGDVEAKHDMSPVVVGCTVAGFFVCLGFVVLALWLARRNTPKQGYNVDSASSSGKLPLGQAHKSGCL